MNRDEEILQSLKRQAAALPFRRSAFSRRGLRALPVRRRVSSYFLQSRDHTAKVRVMVKQIVEIRHIVVDSEQDALLLENSLIKSLQPRYNILLKDDKTYPWIVVRREPFPRVQSTAPTVRSRRSMLCWSSSAKWCRCARASSTFRLRP